MRSGCYTCSRSQITADHKTGDENRSQHATATGEDPTGKTVEDRRSQVDVLHPAVDIEKTGPATATVGTALAYTLTVTNPGDVAFAAQEVVVTDPRCEAAAGGSGHG